MKDFSSAIEKDKPVKQGAKDESEHFMRQEVWMAECSREDVH